jgi:DNA polymerase-3 subunit gamma/tau
MLSLYRRHRPKTFDEVVGQESVVRTLRNAIELDKVHHAYLFVGSRGTGKTSTAKLLACALNAEGGPSTEFDPASPTSVAIMTGSSLDVVEMDAASNNSVDDVRELRENVALTPMGGARRVYILDEAHMLSQAAWNAFLKTLEEPPSHVVFVLATTEAHKVPATIVDRCHRFDFQRPSLDQIAGVVRRVADQEGISIPDPAVGMIARKAAGSFRDALGTLEQLVTYGGTEVALEDVLANLGVADAELILAAADTIAAADPRAALETVQRLADSGRDETQFMRDLAAHLRHLYVVQTLGEVPDSFAVTAAHTDRLAAQAGGLSQGDVLRAIDLLAAALAAVKDGSEPRLQLEVALLKATQPRADQSLQALMHRIDRLETALAGGSATSAAAPAAEPTAGDGAGARAAERSPGSGTGGPAASTSVAAVASGAGAALAAVEVVPLAEPEPQVEPAVEPLAEPPAEPVADAASAAAGPPDAGDLEHLARIWPAVADAVREQNELVAAGLDAARPTALEDGRLTIEFPAGASFAKKKAELNRELVVTALRSLSGYGLAVAFELGDEADEAAGPATLGADELAERLKRDFAAEEIFDDDQPAGGAGAAEPESEG